MEGGKTVLSTYIEEVLELRAELQRLRDPWVSVETAAKPKHIKENVLIIVESTGQPTLGFYDPENGKWRYFSDYSMARGVTHWMPIPTPPEGDKT